MYKHITLSELKKHLQLPKNYKVDAFIVCGGYNENYYKRLFLSSLKDRNIKIEKLKDGFIKKILSVKVNSKRIWFCVEYGGQDYLSFYTSLLCWVLRKTFL